jgi:hypothetical protein
MGEGGWDGGVYSFIQTYLLQQSSKEISNEECIGKDECPKGHSLEANINLSYPFCLTNTEYLTPIHLFFLIFESFFHNLNDAKTNYHKYKNYK